MTAFDDIADAIATLLGQSPAVCAVIEQDDVEPLPAGDADQQAIVVVLGDSEPQQLGGIAGNPIDWVTTVFVRCLATAAADNARPLANGLAAAAYARLAATPDLGITGVYIGEPTLRRRADRSAYRHAEVALVYDVQHRTSSQTLE